MCGFCMLDSIPQTLGRGHAGMRGIHVTQQILCVCLCSCYQDAMRQKPREIIVMPF